MAHLAYWEWRKPEALGLIPSTVEMGYGGALWGWRQEEEFKVILN